MRASRQIACQRHRHAQYGNKNSIGTRDKPRSQSDRQQIENRKGSLKAGKVVHQSNNGDDAQRNHSQKRAGSVFKVCNPSEHGHHILQRVGIVNIISQRQSRKLLDDKP